MEVLGILMVVIVGSIIMDSGASSKPHRRTSSGTDELFVNQGTYAMSTLIYTPISADKIFFETDGEVTVDVEKYDIVVEEMK